MIQEFGFEAWSCAETDSADTIDARHAQQALVAATDNLDTTVYRARTRTVPRSELKYLIAAASLGKGPYSKAAVDKIMGSDHGWARGRLIDRGILYPTAHGYADFTIPGFGDYLNRAYPSPPV